MTKPTQSTIKEELAALSQGKKNPTPIEVTEEAKIDTLITDQLSIPPKKVDGRSKNGGYRPGAGQPPKLANLIAKGQKQMLDDFVAGEYTVDVEIRGKKVTLKKSRVLIATEMLFLIGIKQESPDALNKFLDRALGRPAQPIRGDGDSDAPIRMEHDISSIIAKAYGDDADNGKD